MVCRAPTLLTPAIAEKFPYFANPGLWGSDHNITKPTKGTREDQSLSNTECYHLSLAAELPLVLVEPLPVVLLLAVVFGTGVTLLVVATVVAVVDGIVEALTELEVEV